MESIENKIERTFRYWWLFFVMGVIFIVAGLTALSNPEASFLALTALFVFSFLASGIFRIYYSISARDHLPNWGWHLSVGVLSSLISAYLMFAPALAAATLALAVGFYVLFTSANLISESMELKSIRAGGSNWLLLLGFTGLLASFFLIFQPIFGMGTLILWTSLAFMAHGLYYISMSLRMKSGSKEFKTAREV